MKPLPLLIVSVMVQGCASAPHQPATSTAAAAPGAVSHAGDHPPVATGGSAPAQPGALLPSSASAAASAKPEAKLLHEGYQAANYHGQMVYCRVESPTGSRFERKVCLTPEQIRAREENAKEVLGTAHSDSSCSLLSCQ